ncbi:DUF72 domain-containing protein [Candidatus Nitronereus thalassa]|uniref:DUF72 domain-containing protein n=1 Tax=Candidatus Nitronereus thalassa TaxID=3020898 RepID=A0ABU3KCX0_9BACT|nr:DUF72 domain-containing protein [Candidatus Nitronereus thalassa]MDT7044079.1 DUF72 domain-containing protein [Candidatus Nitronereus thalassa]
MNGARVKLGRIFIGTSGWHYPHWVGPFYPKTMPTSEFISYYSRHFHTVEINNTFYHLPSVETFEAWGKGTPKHFLFACKGSRFITHMKKLKDPEASVQKFFDAIQGLGPKLGPVLFQLPPRWKVNLERLESFLKVLPGNRPFAFEFRDESWLQQETYDLLRHYHAGLCLYHLAGKVTPIEVTADFVYIRLHGPGDAYQGSYQSSVLDAWARKCVMWINAGKDVYCYFDNDEHAYAVKNALALERKVMKRLERSGISGVPKSHRST